MPHAAWDPAPSRLHRRAHAQLLADGVAEGLGAARRAAWLGDVRGARAGALPSLTKLVLNESELGDAGLMALAPSLRRRPALKHLYLQKSYIGNEGVAALAAAAAPANDLRSIETLDLTGNQITHDGYAALAGALHDGALPSLAYLSLRGNPPSRAAPAIVRAARDRGRGRGKTCTVCLWTEETVMAF